jgi:IS5 family transposase
MLFNHYEIETMVPEDHILRQFKEWLLVEGVADDREELKKSLGREGYGYETGLRALFLQFWGDHSDREMEEQLRYNIAYKWFCGFSLEAQTPDHSFFGRTRKNLGEKRISVLFTKIVDQAKLKKIIKKLESFVDASAIKRKEALWEERDKAKEEEEKLNNRNVEKFSADKEARWGCKREGKYWFGYKRHVSVDTGSGLIEAVAVTRANVNDDDGFKLVCPWEKRILADKGYNTWKVYGVMKRRRCKDGVLRQVTRRNYDERRNKYFSCRRAPFERVFSKMSRRTRYMGVKKTYLQALFEGIVHNLKRLAVLEGIRPPVMGLA